MSNPSRPKVASILLVGACIVLLIGLAGGGWIAVKAVNTARAVSRARAAGMVMTWEALDPPRRVRPDADAVPAYRAAMRRYERQLTETPIPTDQTWRILTRRASPALKRQFAVAWPRYAPVVTAFAEASTRADSAWLTGRPQNEQWLINNAAQTFAAFGMLLVEEGDFDATTRVMETVAQMARHLGNLRSTAPIRIQLTAQALAIAQDLARLAPPSAARDRAIEQTLTAFNPFPTGREVLNDEYLLIRDNYAESAIPDRLRMFPGLSAVIKRRAEQEITQLYARAFPEFSADPGASAAFVRTANEFSRRFDRKFGFMNRRPFPPRRARVVSSLPGTAQYLGRLRTQIVLMRAVLRDDGFVPVAEPIVGPFDHQPIAALPVGRPRRYATAGPLTGDPTTQLAR